MLVQFGNNWIQKIPLTTKLDSACSLVQFWLSSEFFSSNYFQIGQHVVLLLLRIKISWMKRTQWTLLNNYDKDDVTSLSDYDVKRKKKIKNLFHLKIYEIKPTFMKAL